MKLTVKKNTVIANCILVGTSLLLLAIVLEFLVFRYVLVASDLPVLSDRSAHVLKFLPNQEGVYRLRNEISAKFRINQQGWNSKKKNYSVELVQDRKRICIVGDSYIEALQVDYDKSVAEQLEKRFLSENQDVEVYRYGISGAPLSHYVYMIENEVLPYRPHLIVVNMVHNDFFESIQPPIGTYSQSLSVVKDSKQGRTILSEPMQYTRGLSWYIKRTATFRYLWVRQQIHLNRLKEYWLSFSQTLKDRETSADQVSDKYVANVQVDETKDNRIREAVDFLFRRLKQIEIDNNLRILLVIDADRAEIISSIEEKREFESQVGHLNRMTQQIAILHNIELLDLSHAFQEDYRVHQKSFRFKYDGHWTEHAHGVTAGAIYKKVVEGNIL